MTEKTKLREFVDRIENLLNEIDVLKEDIRGIYEEAKEADINTKALRKLISRRRNKPVDPTTERLVEEYEMLLNDF